MIWLTGSRYFGGNRDHSDYDFFMEDSPETRRMLLGEGFNQVKTIGRCGPNTNAIFRRDNIDVGLVENLQRKQWEQKVLSTTPGRLLMRSLPKHARIFVWNIIQQI